MTLGQGGGGGRGRRARGRGGGRREGARDIFVVFFSPTVTIAFSELLTVFTLEFMANLLDMSQHCLPVSWLLTFHYCADHLDTQLSSVWEEVLSVTGQRQTSQNQYLLPVWTGPCHSLSHLWLRVKVRATSPVSGDHHFLQVTLTS